MNAKIKQVLCGTVAGAVNGLFGAGGGMVLIPMLIREGKERKQAHRLTVSVVFAMSAAGAFVYGASKTFRWPLLLGGAAGGAAAGLLMQKVDAKLLRSIFAGAAVVSGARLLF